MHGGIWWSMQVSEDVAYRYLQKVLHIVRNDIVFQRSKSPDFLTPDHNYECKLGRRNSLNRLVVTISRKQLDEIKSQDKPCSVIVIEDKKVHSIVSCDLIKSAGCIVDDLYINLYDSRDTITFSIDTDIKNIMDGLIDERGWKDGYLYSAVIRAGLIALNYTTGDIADINNKLHMFDHYEWARQTFDRYNDNRLYKKPPKPENPLQPLWKTDEKSSK